MSEPTIFSGIKVVDFASFIAGPSAATILSDFGAEVVKVEPPTGDPWRNARECTKLGNPLYFKRLRMTAGSWHHSPSLWNPGTLPRKASRFVHSLVEKRAQA